MYFSETDERPLEKLTSGRGTIVFFYNPYCYYYWKISTELRRGTASSKFHAAREAEKFNSDCKADS